MAGCSSAGFTGGSSKKQEDKSADATKTGTGTNTGTGTTTGTATHTGTGTSTSTGTNTGTLGTPGHPQACGAAGITQAQLITTSIKDGDQSAIVEYALSLTDCQGNAQTISADSVLFDFNGVSPGTANLDFSITDGASINYTGKLLIVPHQDLFGNTGDEYEHYKSDNPFKLQTSQPALHIKVHIGETGLIQPITTLDATNNSAPPTSAFPLPTFLKLGDANAVEKDVQVLPP